MKLLRRGKVRKHPQGFAVNLFLGDEILYATAYGGSAQEASGRADTMVRLYNDSRKDAL